MEGVLGRRNGLNDSFLWDAADAGGDDDVGDDSRVRSVMEEGEDALELVEDNDMVSVHRANLGGRGGGDTGGHGCLCWSVLVSGEERD